MCKYEEKLTWISQQVSTINLFQFLNITDKPLSCRLINCRWIIVR